MRFLIAFALALAFTAPVRAVEGALSLVVLDPLAAPLSCPCVEGYAQRQYEKLGEYLSKQLGRPVGVTFAESFEKAIGKDGCETIDLAIGKDSVVRHDAAEMKLGATPLARLTGKDGKTTQTGLIVVRSGDAAHNVNDLKGYRILYGTAECDEKFAAPRAMLSAAGVEVVAASHAETTAACSDGACKIIEWGDSEQAAAVISSYAAPLLEGCGTIKKGDLRVVGETKPVPFITAFATDRVPADVQAKVREALLAVGSNPELLVALESLVGFVPVEDAVAESAADDKAADAVGGEDAAQPKPAATSSWPGWRGPNRDCRVAWLPQKLPEKANIIWRVPMHRSGLGGLAATNDVVVVGDRDVSNSLDEFRCYSARDGTLQWTVSYSAAGQLDYDNNPRATPLIHAGRVYLLGAFGHLTCADLATGAIEWQMNLIEMFEGDPELVWGTCSSPLIADDKLIVNPGGPAASIVALDPATGTLLWQTPGDRHAYASFIVATLGGVRQLVGYDRTSLGGWDLSNGNRLWTLKPPHAGDFNVPTPVVVDGRLVVVTENNGARAYEFDVQGKIIPETVSLNEELAPDVSSPATLGDRLFCVWNDFYCLDAADGMQTIWIGKDKALGDSSPLFVSDERVLAFGAGGELLLIDSQANEFRIISRLHIFDDRESRFAEQLSHPALVGTRLYLRGEKELVGVELNERL